MGQDQPRYVKVAGSCDDGDCPTVYLDAEGNALVQGFITGHLPVGYPDGMPDGEAVVRVPAAHLQTLLAQLPK